MKTNHLFKERLTQAILRSKKSTNQIERELGYPRNALHNYKLGSEPSATRLIELSQYFQLSPSYLMGMSPNCILNNPNNYFKQLNEEQKLEIFKITQEWVLKKMEEQREW